MMHDFPNIPGLPMLFPYGLWIILWPIYRIVIPIIVGVWMHQDAATRRNPSSVLWVLGAIVSWIPALVIYLIVRPDYRTSEQ